MCSASTVGMTEAGLIGMNKRQPRGKGYIGWKSNSLRRLDMVVAPTQPQPLLLQLPDDIGLTVTQEQFIQLAAANRDLRLERTYTGKLSLNPPTGWLTSARITHITRCLANWAETFGGLVLESSCGCQLPNGSLNAPDAAWLSETTPARVRQLPPLPGNYLPLCPDFVVELSSNADRIISLQQKMHEYMENGAQLDWLIDPVNQRVQIYRAGQGVEVLEQPSSLSGEDVLPGFILSLTRIWT